MIPARSNVWTERERAAWRMGFETCRRGGHHNPYPADSAEAEAWRDGYRHSLRDERPATE